jgi:hypothetical protein
MKKDKKGESVKKKPGRPQKYQDHYPKLAEKFTKLGATDKDLADLFEVNIDTIHDWKKTFPQFSDSLKKGKEIADSLVIQSLFKRATGYEHEDTDIRTVSVGNGISQIVETPIMKKYPPDPTSMIFWLKNRRPQEWRDKQEVDHTTAGNKIEQVVYYLPQSNLIKKRD